MAGTLFGLPLSQPVDLNGKPLIGCKLYVTAAGGYTQSVTAYKDFGLTVGQELPYPIPSDAWGRLPIFWLPDGAYAFRLVSADGDVVSSSLNVQALGPSSGEGGGGSTVDPDALIQTGDLSWRDTQGTRSGFVRDNARTIGSSTSGATERANSDVQPLYTFLWSNFADGICPVTGGRGASAAADYAANKPIQLPDKRGYVVGGLDDMGNSAAGRYASVPVISGDVTTAGSVLGESLHTLSINEIPSHNHTLTDPGHNHRIHSPATANLSGLVSGVLTNNTGGSGPQDLGVTDTNTTGISIASAGGGGAHNNVQKTVLGTFYRKL